MTGTRGPKSLPANVHAIRGNPSKLPLSQLMDELQPLVEIPNCPAHLLPEARREWKRITPELQRYGLISKLDRAALALYCQAYATWVWADQQLLQAVAAAAEGKAKAEAEGKPWTGGDGYTIPTPNGHLGYSPHWVIRNKAMEQVKQFAAEFGLSPVHRGRVSMSNNRQADWVGHGEEDDQKPQGFGAL